MKCLVTVALWGESYVDRFLSLSLPSQLSDGNLGVFRAKTDSTYLIVTTEKDRRKIESSPCFLALKKLINTTFLIVKSPPKSDKYLGASFCQYFAIQQSSGYDAIIFVYPDFIFADGAIRTALRCLAEGSDAVTMPVPRVSERQFIPRFIERTGGRAAADAIRSLPARELVALANQTLHPTMRQFIWDSDDLASYPSSLLWSVGDDGLLMRCFHTHPLAIRVDEQNPGYASPFRVSLDEEYLPKAIASSDLVHCIADSDDATICSLSDDQFAFAPVSAAARRSVVRFVSLWAEGHAATLHRELVRRPYRWHSTAIDPAAWAAVERESAAFVERVLDRLKIPDCVLEYEDRQAHDARRARARRWRRWRRQTALSLAAAQSDTLTLARILFLRIVGALIGGIRSNRWTGPPFELVIGRLRRLRRFQTAKSHYRAMMSAFEQEPIPVLAIALTRRLGRLERPLVDNDG